MISNHYRFNSALNSVQVRNTHDNVWYLKHIIDNYDFSPLGLHSQSKMWVGNEDAAFLLQALVIAKGYESVLCGYDGGIGYYLWDEVAQMWNKVDYDTYVQR